MANEQIDLDKKMLERGYWIATHRLAIERWTTRALYLFILLMYLIFFVQFGIYMYRLNQWNVLLASSITPLMDWRAIHEQRSPLEVEFGTPLLFASGEGRYDFVVEVYNPNEQWAIESLTYEFVYGDDQRTPAQQTFVLPGERRYITVLGFESAEPITSIASFNASQYRWHKVSHLPPLSWDFTEPPLYTPRQTIVENRIQRVLPASVGWTVRNASTLNIRTVVWQVVFLSGNSLAGVAEYRREDFPFLEERSFSFSVSDAVGRVDRVKVFPIVNIFDPNFSYLPQT